MAWDAIPGWTCGRLREWYAELAIELADHEAAHFVEIGVAYGASLAFFCEQLTHPVRVTGVDIWEEHQGKDQLPADVWARVKEHGTPIQACLAEWRRSSPVTYWWAGMHRATGKDAALVYADGSIDAVFIDEHHTYESVGDAIKAWMPKVRSGGWLSGHDLNDHYPGVGKAVFELLPNAEVREPLPEDMGWGGIWKWRKP